MPDRQITISTAKSVETKKWNVSTITASQFIQELNWSREIHYTPEDFAKLTTEQRRDLKNGPCYVFGALDDTGKRQKGHILTREGLTYDLDNINRETLNEVLFCLSESGYNYAVHSTASYDGKNAKVRVIIPFSRAISPEEYKAKAKAAAPLFAIPVDDDVSSFEDTRALYRPTNLKGVEPLYEACTDGEFLDPDTLEAPEMPLERVTPAEPQVMPKNEERAQIDDLTAMEAVRKQVHYDWKNLQDRENYLAALMVIVSAVQHGEITREAGEACAVLLAGDRKDWKEPNRKQFFKELENTTTRTKYTFWQKFGGGKQSPAGDSSEANKTDLVCLADIEPKDVFWLWEGYIPRGMLFGIQGDPGSGKTYSTLSICAGITRGELPPDLFGPVEIPPENILYVNGEDSLEHTIVPRLIKLRADMTRCFTLDEREKALDFSQLDRIKRAVEKARPALVIFDPIQAFLGASVDMHKANEVRPVMAALSRLADEFSFACGLVGHMNKYGGGKAIYRGLGSIDQLANYRTAFLIGNDRRASGQKIMLQIKNNLDRLAPPQIFRIENDKTISWLGPDPEAKEADILQEAAEKEGTALNKAITWLRGLLEEKPVWSNELDGEAGKNEISRATYERARATLRESWEIDKYRAPVINRWYWAKRGKQVHFGTEDEGKCSIEYEDDEAVKVEEVEEVEEHCRT